MFLEGLSYSGLVVLNLLQPVPARDGNIIIRQFYNVRTVLHRGAFIITKPISYSKI